MPPPRVVSIGFPYLPGGDTRLPLKDSPDSIGDIAGDHH